MGLETRSLIVYAAWELEQTYCLYSTPECEAFPMCIYSIQIDDQFIVLTSNSYIQNYKTKWHTKKTWNFENICLYETGKVAVPARVISSDVRWHRIFHESIHVLRETCARVMSSERRSIPLVLKYFPTVTIWCKNNELNLYLSKHLTKNVLVCF